MRNWIKPEYSKNAVRKAGETLRHNPIDLNAISVLENWRASHAYVINTFQANLRLRSNDISAVVGQRLKRRPTIIDKLSREPQMDLSRMHDIAGCRVIFDNMDALFKFRRSMIETRAKHVRITEGRDQFNYIDRPKPSGYRGVHDVYRYNVNSVSGVPWNGLLIEIQYRTQAQHAWATAVETADLLTRSRGKFSDASDEYLKLFAICSEIIARFHEASNSCLRDYSDLDLIEGYNNLEGRLNVIRTLRNANRITPQNMKGILKKGKNVILTYPFIKEKDVDFALQARSFDSHKLAIEYYEKQEETWKERADVVLVSSANVEGLMSVFQNYFQDTRKFIGYLDQARRAMS